MPHPQLPGRSAGRASRRALAALVVGFGGLSASAAHAQTTTVDYDYDAITVTPVANLDPAAIGQPLPAFPDVAAANAAEVAQFVAALPANGGRFCAGPAATVSGTTINLLPNGPSAGGGCTTFTTSTAYTLSRISQFQDRTTNVTSFTVTPNIAGLASPLPAAAGASRADAAALALQSARQFYPALRLAALGISVTGSSSSTQIVGQSTLSSLVTSADGLVITTTTVIRDGGTIVIGTRGMCAQAVSNCEGGVRLNFAGGGAVNIQTLLVTNYVVTDTVERTLQVTTTEADALNLAALGTGAIFAAAQPQAFDVAHDFVRGLFDRRDGRRVWIEAHGAQTRADATALAGPARGGHWGVSFGGEAPLGAGWSAGLAVNLGRHDLDEADPLAPGHAEGGDETAAALVRWTGGGWRLAAAASAGRYGLAFTQTPVAADASRARTHGDVFALGGQIGRDFRQGKWTFGLEAGAVWLRWRGRGFTEAGGPAPLAALPSRSDEGRFWETVRADWGSERAGVGAFVRALELTGEVRGNILLSDPLAPGVITRRVGPNPGSFAGEGGLEAHAMLGPRLTLSGGYVARLSRTSPEQSGFLRLTAAW